MNLIIKADSVAPAMFKRTLAIAHAEIRKCSQGHVCVIFGEGIPNAKIAQILGILLRKNPQYSFAMVSDIDMSEQSLQGFLTDISEDNIETIFVDSENLN